MLTIAVRDTGIGIRQEELGKIFDKFERTDLERNSTVEGTGLGLAITHHLLEMMGGSIAVESEYGVGSVFTIRLPQRFVSAEPIGDFHEKFEKSMEERHTPVCLFRAPAAQILIVDDTRMNLSVAAGLLKDTEIQTDLAETGAAALKLCLANRYDLILLDQRMPAMYAIIVHSLKSTSRTIGAEALSGIAAKLEAAADEGRWEYVSGSHADLLAQFDALIRRVTAVTGEEVQEAGAFDEDEILDFFPDSSG